LRQDNNAHILNTGLMLYCRLNIGYVIRIVDSQSQPFFQLSLPVAVAIYVVMYWHEWSEHKITSPCCGGKLSV